MIIKSVFDKRKSVALIIVMGVVVIIASLCFISSFLMSQQARIAEHKIRRMRAYYAAMAGVVYAFDQARKGNLNDGDTIIRIGNGINGYPSKGFKVDINKSAGKGIDNTDKIDVAVNYTL